MDLFAKERTISITDALGSTLNDQNGEDIRSASLHRCFPRERERRNGLERWMAASLACTGVSSVVHESTSYWWDHFIL